MKKIELFDTVLNRVCEVCMVRPQDVIEGRKFEAVVDARLLAVQYLRRIGLSNDDIALIILKKKHDDMGYYPSDSEWKSKSKAIAKMFNSYSERCMQSYSFCLISKGVKDFCTDLYSERYVHGMKNPPTK